MDASDTEKMDASDWQRSAKKRMAELEYSLERATRECAKQDREILQYRAALLLSSGDLSWSRSRMAEEDPLEKTQREMELEVRLETALSQCSDLKVELSQYEAALMVSASKRILPQEEVTSKSRRETELEIELHGALRRCAQLERKLIESDAAFMLGARDFMTRPNLIAPQPPSKSEKSQREIELEIQLKSTADRCSSLERELQQFEAAFMMSAAKISLQKPDVPPTASSKRSSSADRISEKVPPHPNTPKLTTFVKRPSGV